MLCSQAVPDIAQVLVEAGADYDTPDKYTATEFSGLNSRYMFDFSTHDHPFFSIEYHPLFA